MFLEFPCEKCQALLRVPDTARGKKAACPACGQVMRVPDAANAPLAGAAEAGAPTESAPGAPGADALGWRPPASDWPAATGRGESIPVGDEPPAPEPPRPPENPAASWQGSPSEQPPAEQLPLAGNAPLASSEGFSWSKTAGDLNQALAGAAGDKSQGAAPGNPYSARGAEARSGFEPSAGNPYASPAYLRTPGGFEGAGAALAPIPLTIGSLLEITWKIYTERFGALILGGLIVWALSMGSGAIALPLRLVGQALVDSGEPPMAIVGLGLMLASVLVSSAIQIWVTLGNVHFNLTLLKQGRVTYGEFFNVFGRLGSAFLQCLMLGLLYFGVGLLCLSPAVAVLVVAQGAPDGAAAAGVLALVGALVWIVFVVYFNLSMQLSFYFLLDRDQGAFAALQSSGREMYGRKLTVFLALTLAGFVATPVLCLTCGLGGMFVAPYFATMTTVVYLFATGQSIQPARP